MSGFPVTETKKDWRDIIKEEGYFLTENYNLNNVISGVSYVEKVYISISHPSLELIDTRVFIRNNRLNINTIPEFSGGDNDMPVYLNELKYNSYMVKNNTVLEINYNRLFLTGEEIVCLFPTGGGNVTYSIKYSRWWHDSDGRFDAKRKMLCIGDSVTTPQLNVTRFLGHMHQQAKEYLNSKSLDFRYISRPFPGKSSIHAVGWMKQKYFEMFKDLDLIIIQFGINDASHALTNAQILEAYNYFISWRNSYNQNAELIFISANPVSDNSISTRTIDIFQNIVLPLSDISKKIYAIDITNAFDRLNNTYLVDSVHPSQAGHDKCAEIIINSLKAIY